MDRITKSISIFGATGSVGQQAVDIVARDPETFEVQTLTAEKNVALLAKTAKKVNAQRCIVSDIKYLDALTQALQGTGIEALAGNDALCKDAETNVDISVQAIVGFSGVAPSLLAAKHCKILALANKESVVCAGEILKSTCITAGTELIPLDSEHSAIFQCLKADPKNLKRIILTASGGPFLNYSASDLQSVTPKQASTHPNWKMGQRITIDSASMFNKAMEMIEAQVLFDLEPEQIEVVVHPQSILHSAIVLEDEAIIAQIGATDMRMPISYALSYPNRKSIEGTSFDLTQMTELSFLKPDRVKFPAITLAERAMQLSGKAGLVLNAAKEVGLDFFISDKIKFTDMARGVAHSLEVYANSGESGPDTLDALIAMNDEYRQVTKAFFEREH